MTDYDLAPGEEVPDTVLEAQWLAESEAAPPPPPVSRGHLTSVPNPVSQRIPPHNVEAEESLLGAMLLSRAATDIGATQLKAEDFYKPAHAHVFAALAALAALGDPIDPVTVSEHLQRKGLLELIGGPATLIRLQAATPATSSAARYATIVHEHAILRRLIGVAGEMSEMGYALPEDVNGTVGQAQALLDEIHDATAAVDDRLQRIADTVVDYTDQLEARQEHPLVGISSGLAGLDTAIGGFQRGRFYTIAGRPGMGKSDVAIVLARAAANAGHQTLVTSIEMPTTELLDRWVANGSKLSASILSHGELGLNAWERITAALVDLQDLPIWIDDNPASTIASIRADVRRSGAELVIIDYLQIVETAAAESRQVEVTVLARALKRMARELDIPVIALAQLNRGLEQRHDKRPQLSDLRESGAIEQESDVVIGLYQDAHYVKDSPDRGVMELIILKNRTGPLTTVKVAYLPDTKTIANLAGAN